MEYNNVLFDQKFPFLHWNPKSLIISTYFLVLEMYLKVKGNRLKARKGTNYDAERHDKIEACKAKAFKKRTIRMILKSVPIAIQRAHCIKEEGGLHQNKLQYSQLRLRKKKMHSFFPFPFYFSTEL